MLPKVILHNSVSLDGRIVGFNIDMGLHYELMGQFKIDVQLAGSETLLSQEEEIPPGDVEVGKPPEIDPDDDRPMLVVPDSSGRIRFWHFLCKQPYWRDILVLCSRSTPKEYLEFLEKRYIKYIITGEDKVDLRSALEELNSKYGVKTILLDSGGTLNGVMLREGLVSEISILVHPALVGGTTNKSIFRGPDLTSNDDVIKLKFINSEKKKDNMVWLRYEIIK